MNEKISICIPAYKRTHFLERLLTSITNQTYKNYEVIVTDDSDDNSVRDLCERFSGTIALLYYKNPTPLGTPKNWMAAIEKATGQWIKLIHDDDWFAEPDSLQQYADATSDNNVRFIFSGYNAFYEATHTYVNKTISQATFHKIKKNPLLLFANNLIGPPSVLMFHNEVTEYYDTNLKWLVDLEYYVSVLEKENALYVSKPLVNMSYNDTQVTTFCFGNPEIEIPEALYMYHKHTSAWTKHIMVYDAWWRLMRNTGIRSVSKLKEYAGAYPIPKFLSKIVKHQLLFPGKVLKFGIVSKAVMLVSYLINYKHLTS